MVVGEPGTVYLHHITLETGTGTAIVDGLHTALDEMALLEKILAVGADSTPSTQDLKVEQSICLNVDLFALCSGLCAACT